MKIAMGLVLALCMIVAAGTLPCPCCESMSTPAAACGGAPPASPAPAGETPAPPCHDDPAPDPGPIGHSAGRTPASDPCGCDHVFTVDGFHLDLPAATTPTGPVSVRALTGADAPADPIPACSLRTGSFPIPHPPPDVGPPSSFSVPLRI